MSRKLLLTGEVAERCRVPVNTVRYWRQVGEGPPSVRLGRRVVYDEAELDAWIDSRFAAEREAGR